MRKSFLMGLGLAASLAGIAAAQQPGAAPRRDSTADHRGRRGQFEGRGPAGYLLKDITLSDAQKAQLKQLHQSERDAMQAKREQMKQQFEQARAARQKGDTATARAIMERNRLAMEQNRDKEFAAIRNILTADQRVQFDKNVAELKQRQAQRGERFGARGERGERGERGQGRGFRGGKGKPGGQR